MEDKKTAIYALTGAGAETAAKLAAKLPDARLFLPAKFQTCPDAVFFRPGEFTTVLETNWAGFEAHIFVMATGIVVRKISGLMRNKTVDPAIVVCDETGKFAISLLSGHIGGANRMAEKVASILGGQAVITTATDVQGIMAFDELAAINDWQIRNPENIKPLNTLLLENKPIAVLLPEEVYQKFYSERKSVVPVGGAVELDSGDFAGAVIYGPTEMLPGNEFPILFLGK